MKKLNLINNIIESNTKAIFVLLVIALTFRIVLINSYNQKKISPDGIGYHTIAVNIVERNGYSNSFTEPYEPYFFREPGYPFFLAMAYKIYDGFGGELKYLSDYRLEDYSYESSHCEIVLVKYFQVILDSATLLLFYLSLLHFFKRKYAFFIILILSVYLPLALQVTFVLRECLQIFFSMAMTFSYIRYISNKKSIWLIIFSISWALLTLTFQAFIILPVFLFIFLLIYSKNLWGTIRNCFIAGIIMILISLPWLLRSYSLYPDIRVFKSFGTTLTSEYQSYIGALDKARYYSHINDKDFHDILMSDYVNLPAKEKYEISFNGELKSKADSVNALVDEPIISKRKVRLVVKNFLNSWFRRITLNELGENMSMVAKYKIFGVNIYSNVHLLFTVFGLLLGFLALIGLIIFYKKIYPLLLVFTMYMSVFFVLGSEARRMFPIQPFVFMFFILAVLVLYLKYARKLSIEGIMVKLLCDNKSTGKLN